MNSFDKHLKVPLKKHTLISNSWELGVLNFKVKTLYIPNVKVLQSDFQDESSKLLTIHWYYKSVSAK